MYDTRDVNGRSFGLDNLGQQMWGSDMVFGIANFDHSKFGNSKILRWDS